MDYEKMRSGEGVDVVIDASGAALSAYYLDRLVSAVFIAENGRADIGDFTIISHPFAADDYRSEIRSCETLEDVKFLLEIDAEKRIARWIMDVDMPKDMVRVESKDKCGILKNLTVYGV